MIDAKVEEGVSEVALAQLLMVAAGQLLADFHGGEQAQAMFVTIGNHVGVTVPLLDEEVKLH